MRNTTRTTRSSSGSSNSSNSSSSTSIVKRDSLGAFLFGTSRSSRGNPRMDTLDTLFAYSQGDTRLDTLESLYNYSREEMNYVGTRRSTIQAQTKAPTSIGSTSTPDTEKEMLKCDDPQRQLADDSRDETAIQEFVETKEPELGVLLTRVTDNLACCTRNIRVSDYMDEAFLEDDFHELVYRPSRRPGALHNALTTSPSYDEGLIKPVLSNITESDEKTVHTLDTTKTKELSTKNIASLYMDYANWSRAFCGDI